MRDWNIFKFREYMSKEEMDLHIKFILDLFEVYSINSKNMTALEIGSGAGRHTLYLKCLFKKLIASDSDENMINALKEKIPDIETYIVDCENFKSNIQFNFVIFTNSFMWINDKQKCLLNISKYIKKDGYLLILEPSRFLISLDKKFSRQVNFMLEVIQTIVRSQTFKLIHFLPGKTNIIYLLQKE